MVTEEILNFGEIKGIQVGGSLLGAPLMTVIYYYFDNILIDTGPYSARKSIKRFIEEYKVDKALLTHYHEDHAGNAKFLVDSGIPVYGNAKTVSKLKEKNRLKPYEHILFGKLEKVAIHSLPEVVITKRYNLVPLHTPGHSVDHTVFHEPNRGWLFSGDLFLAPKIKYWRKDEDMLETINSLERVLQLDFDCLFCGHNPKLKKPKEFIKMKRLQLIDLVVQVKDLLQQGFCKNEIINILAKGKEKRVAKWFTLGDASYKNMILAAIDVAMHKKAAMLS